MAYFHFACVYFFFLSLFLSFIHFFIHSQRTSTRMTSKKPQAKIKNNVDGRILRESSESGDSILNRSNRSNSVNGEWKSTIMQRKKLMNSTNAAAQQQTKATGPTSPTEATCAPIYYNSNTNDSRNGEWFRFIFNDLIFKID